LPRFVSGGPASRYEARASVINRAQCPGGLPDPRNAKREGVFSLERGKRAEISGGRISDQQNGGGERGSSTPASGSVRGRTKAGGRFGDRSRSFGKRHAATPVARAGRIAFDPARNGGVIREQGDIHTRPAGRQSGGGFSVHRGGGRRRVSAGERIAAASPCTRFHGDVPVFTQAEHDRAAAAYCRQQTAKHRHGHHNSLACPTDQGRFLLGSMRNAL